jgi:hypothetical protein
VPSLRSTASLDDERVLVLDQMGTAGPTNPGRPTLSGPPSASPIAGSLHVPHRTVSRDARLYGHSP